MLTETPLLATKTTVTTPTFEQLMHPLPFEMVTVPTDDLRAALVFGLQYVSGGEFRLFVQDLLEGRHMSGWASHRDAATEEFGAAHNNA